MKRLLASTIFTLTIIILYQFININLFSLDLLKIVRSQLFKSLRHDPEVDPTILIVDIEYMALEKVKEQLEVLESLGPKVIGVNLCNISETNQVLDNYLTQSKTIITCNCEANSNRRTSRITSPKNEVTHFLTDKGSYFELQLSERTQELQRRQNHVERINFRAKEMYYQLPISQIDSISPDLVKNQIVLVGFLRDSLITPMNPWYGRSSIDEGDMSDAQISANIISTINRNEFINEVNPFLRVIIILFISLSNTVLLRFLRARRDILNILSGVAFFIVFNGLSGALIVFSFSQNYYLNLDEVTIVLFISGIISIYWNAKDNKRSSQNAEHVIQA